ncbi:MAG: HAD-IA family hydrolase [Legionella sp.]|uniref:HAD family hydrolase n=1 Tax=Legionella sp. TaxID=459 RepID=UPI0039E2A625
MPYQVILFDLDDTLIDFVAAEAVCLRKIYEQFYNSIDYSFFKTHYHNVNNELWSRVGASENALLPGDVRFMRFKELNARLAYDAEHIEIADLYEYLLGEEADWFPNVKRAIELLHQKGHILGIITNGLSDSQARKYERLELNRWFDCFIVSDEVGYAKPQKEIFDLALEAIANKHQQPIHIFDKKFMLMVGDSMMNDGQGAMNFGIKYCHINKNADDLNTPQATLSYHINSVAQLPAALGYE